jgi:energy-coupling factor transport system ATP-binding protein
MSEIVIRTENLSYRYPTRQEFAVNNVNLEITRGEFLAIIGQNGSGKTTLVKHFNGLLKPTEGRLLVEDQDTKDMVTSDLARFVGYVFQNPDHQIFAEKVRDEIAFGPKNLGMDEAKIAEVSQAVLEEVGLTGKEDVMPFQLSRGERQRLAVASILAMEPSILIVDEPTTGQDWQESIALMELIKQLNDKGHTCIVITHSMNLVSHYARRVVVMYQGEVLLDGPTEDVFSDRENMARAKIKPPEVYELANALFPAARLQKAIQPKDLAAMILAKEEAAP